MSKPVYSTLITTTQLNNIINEESLRLFDCRFYLTNPDNGLSAYKNEHIPNSQYADLNKQLAGPVLASSGRHPLPDKYIFQDQLRKWGIDESSQVIVYDDASGAIAARMWWTCLWAGITNVAVLDGGIQAWSDSGLNLTDDVPRFSLTKYQAVYNDQLWASTREIEALLTRSTVSLTDARAAIRYRGESEPIDSVAGHVPGSLNLPFEQNLDHNGHFLEKYQLIDHHRESSQIKEVISMCGSGVTACHNILARAHAGLDMGKLYVGSWSEWITDPKRKTVTA